MPINEVQLVCTQVKVYLLSMHGFNLTENASQCQLVSSENLHI